MSFMPNMGALLGIDFVDIVAPPAHVALCIGKDRCSSTSGACALV